MKTGYIKLFDVISQFCDCQFRNVGLNIPLCKICLFSIRVDMLQ